MIEYRIRKENFVECIQKKKINIIPLIDVIFLLLIFFMLATNFNQNQNIDFSTPEKLTESNSDSDTILDLKIQNNGYFLLDGFTFKNEKELKENIIQKWNKKGAWRCFMVFI